MNLPRNQKDTKLRRNKINRAYQILPDGSKRAYAPLSIDDIQRPALRGTTDNNTTVRVSRAIRDKLAKWSEAKKNYHKRKNEPAKFTESYLANNALRWHIGSELAHALLDGWEIKLTMNPLDAGRAEKDLSTHSGVHVTSTKPSGHIRGLTIRVHSQAKKRKSLKLLLSIIASIAKDFRVISTPN